MRGVLVGSAAAVFLIAVVSWVLGFTLVEPQNHAVPLPAGFEAQIVSIPGSEHAIAGWWVDWGGQSPVVLQPRLHISESDLEPIRSIGRLGAPVMVAAGSRDEHTTLAESQELFAAAAEPK